AQCDAMLLGREVVEGAVHASSLACLVRGLAGTKARPNRQGRRYLLRCSESGVELVARRPALRPLGSGLALRADDEGFESDEDRRSTRSDDSTSVSSSCCLVDDHVFKAGQGSALSALVGVTAPATSSTSSDSANSSGGSDTDEVDAKASHDAVSVDTASSASSAVASGPFRENFSFQDVAFCHVDAAFPRVVVLVVRRAAAPRRLRATGGPSGLEALVLECRGEEGVRALCSAYQELSRRVRMDGAFRAPHRRKDDAPKDAATAATVVSGAVLPKFIFSKVDEAAAVPGEASRFNLVQRTDGDGVTHIEVSRGSGASLVSVDDASAGGSAASDVADDDHLCGPSSIISISTPDAGNILSSADRSRINKEIEGVIRADVENNATLRRDAGHRQRQHPDEPKLWTTALTADDDAATAGLGSGLSGPSSLPPPQRPERKRFVRKNKAPAPPAPSQPGDANAMKKKTVEAVVLNNTLNRVSRPLSAGPLGALGAEQRVVRGQFIRVSVDQQAKQQGWPSHQSHQHPHVSHFPAGWTGPPPARSATPSSVSHGPHHWGVFPDADHRRYQRRSRSSDSGRGQPRPRSPPAPRRPMAYRYIDAHTPAPRPHPAAPGATTNSLSNRFFGLSQKLREIGGSVVGGSLVGGYPGSGRRNSWGDSPTRFYTSLDPPKPSAPGANNLKSVIKKNHVAGGPGPGGAEPKKVTFSAYATVQVVD
ncbi:uncharacterized protein LOC117643008, partial [Thrips palmi]|uniref:Uncharacterized protein LOC117643008 n=1 Tax=Thrips palmi TaxID=161013 RepID=A0A6P8YKI3_THRPL